jgi:hypothetical protein
VRWRPAARCRAALRMGDKLWDFEGKRLYGRALRAAVAAGWRLLAVPGGPWRSLAALVRLLISRFSVRFRVGPWSYVSHWDKARIPQLAPPARGRLMGAPPFHRRRTIVGDVHCKDVHCKEEMYSVGSPTLWPTARSFVAYSELRSVGRGGSVRL